MTDLSPDELYGIRSSAGLLVLGLDMRIVSAETGKDVKMDGEEMGGNMAQGTLDCR